MKLRVEIFELMARRDFSVVVGPYNNVKDVATFVSHYNERKPTNYKVSQRQVWLLDPKTGVTQRHFEVKIVDSWENPDYEKKTKGRPEIVSPYSHLM